MADYIKMGNSRTGYCYVLMLVDKFSRLVRFLPARSTTAIFACRAVLLWAAQHGLPTWLVSDGGSHFANELLEELTECLGIRHHITLAYCPWANGSVEVVGSDLCWTSRAILSEFMANKDEWDLTLPLVEMTINHRPRDVLGGLSAIEVVTGRAPNDPVELVVWKGVLKKDAVRLRIKAERVAEYCERLNDSLDELHEAIQDRASVLRRRRAMKNARKPGMRFNVGDLVMVSASKNAAHPIRASKMMVKWQGPYQIVQCLSPTSFGVQMVGGGPERAVHWRKMRRIAGPDVDVPTSVQTRAMHDAQRFLVEEFRSHKRVDGKYVLEVKWQGYPDTDNTFESLDQMFEDVPFWVRRYVRDTDDDGLTRAYDTLVSNTPTDDDE